MPKEEGYKVRLHKIQINTMHFAMIRKSVLPVALQLLLQCPLYAQAGLDKFERQISIDSVKERQQIEYCVANVFNESTDSGRFQYYPVYEVYRKKSLHGRNLQKAYRQGTAIQHLFEILNAKELKLNYILKLQGDSCIAVVDGHFLTEGGQEKWIVHKDGSDGVLKYFKRLYGLILQYKPECAIRICNGVSTLFYGGGSIFGCCMGENLVFVTPQVLVSSLEETDLIGISYEQQRSVLVW